MAAAYLASAGETGDQGRGSSGKPSTPETLGQVSVPLIYMLLPVLLPLCYTELCSAGERGRCPSWARAFLLVGDWVPYLYVEAGS